MLTDKDIKKIDGLLTKRIGEEIIQSENRLAGVIENNIEKAIAPIKKELTYIKKEMVPIKKDIVKIRKDQKTIVNFFDKEYLDLRERVEVIERRLNIGI